MDEIIQRERECNLRLAARLRGSQPQDNTLINSDEKKANGQFKGHDNSRISPADGVIDETTVLIPKRLADSIANSQPPKVVSERICNR